MLSDTLGNAQNKIRRNTTQKSTPYIRLLHSTTPKIKPEKHNTKIDTIYKVTTLDNAQNQIRRNTTQKSTPYIGLLLWTTLKTKSEETQHKNRHHI